MKHTLSVQNIDVERYSDAYCWAAKAAKLDGVNTTQRGLEVEESQQFQQMYHMQ